MWCCCCCYIRSLHTYIYIIHMDWMANDHSHIDTVAWHGMNDEHVCREFNVPLYVYTILAKHFRLQILFTDWVRTRPATTQHTHTHCIIISITLHIIIIIDTLEILVFVGAGYGIVSDHFLCAWFSVIFTVYQHILGRSFGVGVQMRNAWGQWWESRQARAWVRRVFVISSACLAMPSNCVIKIVAPFFYWWLFYFYSVPCGTDCCFRIVHFTQLYLRGVCGFRFFFLSLRFASRSAPYTVHSRCISFSSSVFFRCFFIIIIVNTWIRNPINGDRNTF